MYLEYDWTSGVYRPRFGSVFTDFRGWYSFGSLKEAREVLTQCGCRLGRKTDTRSWQILSV